MRVDGYGTAIDRSRPLRFVFDGAERTGFAGDTLASALLADGVTTLATSVNLGRPRGVMSAGDDEASALVQVEAPFPEPMLTATAVELYEGLVARGLPGRGALAPDPDPASYDSVHVHCEVLVVGAGPAGLAAALTAARAGVRVVVVDAAPRPGGSLLGELDGWVTDAVAELAASPDVTMLSRTTAFGYYDDGFVLALERRTDHLGAGAPGTARQRVHRIRAKQVIVATGAHERPYAFTGNDLPGVLLAGAARTYLHRYGVLVARRPVLVTTNDSAYAVALDLAGAGAAVTLVDVRADPPAEWAERCAAAGVEVLRGLVVSRATGSAAVTGAVLSDGRTLDADAVLVSAGWSPTVHLYSQARGRLEWSDELVALVPGEPLRDLRACGAAAGDLATGAALTGGVRAAGDALASMGVPAPAVTVPDVPAEPTPTPPAVLWSVPAEGDGPDTRFVDLQRDATVSDVLRATGAGLRSVEHVKRYTTIGTAHDQGKTSGLLATGVVADALGAPVRQLGTTTFRPPYTSVAFAALAGRDRGELFDPVRVTAMHDWHVANGAVFENVGQWKRPQFYPAPGESPDDAVRRETVAVRTAVGMMDASTLGKIDVQGPDAGEFLDRMYTNLMSSLKVGSVRYGVMCGLDGMVIDDGTVMRLAEDRFVLTTTTGNAAMVLDWMEEFRQTEWPELTVWLTSVTEHWATVAVAGPASRSVIGAVFPDLDVSVDGFPFMTWRDAMLGDVAARVCRISFSGELAYEVNVPWWYGRAAWDALLAAGAGHGITPYGTDAMHVLRAEKAYPIIGQDTDGTVTPQDLGMSWVVSKKKPDFVGKRSFSRPENLRPDRKQLVGLLPVHPATLLDEGAQLIESATVDTVPVPMLGHVTSSYRSAALGSAFALALVRGGRERIGQTLYAWSSSRPEPVAVTVTEPVLYDPEGKRRDG